MGRPKNVVVERVYRPDAAACEAALAALLKDAPRKNTEVAGPAQADNPPDAKGPKHGRAQEQPTR